MKSVYRVIAGMALVLLVGALLVRLALQPSEIPVATPGQGDAQSGAADLPARRYETLPVQVPIVTATPSPTPMPPVTVELEQRIGKGTILDLRYSPDGQRIAVLSPVGIHLYDAQTLREVALLPKQLASAMPKLLNFSPDSRLIAVAEKVEYSDQILVWDIAEQQVIHTFQPEAPVGDLIFLPDGRNIVVGTRVSPRSTVAIWSLYRDQPDRVLGEQLEAVNDLALSSDGAWLASASDDGSVLLWQLQASQQPIVVREPTYSPIQHVEFSRDGKRLVVAKRSGEMQVYDLPAQQPVAAFDHRDIYGGANTILFSGRSDELFAVLTTGVVVRPALSRAGAQTFQSPRFIRLARLSPNEEELCLVLDNNEAHFFKLPLEQPSSLQEPVRVLSEHKGESLVDASPLDRGESAALFFRDGSYEIRKLPYGELIRRDDSNREIFQGAYRVHVATELPIAAPERVSGKVQIWNLQEGRLLSILERSEASAVSLSSNGQAITAKYQGEQGARQGFVGIWQLGSNVPMRTWQVSEDFLIALALSPDAQTLASLSWDNLSIWRVENGERIAVLQKTLDVPPHSELHFSPSAEHLFVLNKDLRPPYYTYGTVQLWTLSGSGTAPQKMTIAGPSIAQERSRDLRFSPDGNWVALASHSDILLFNLSRPEKEVIINTNYTSAAEHLLFTPDGQRLISIHDDGTWLVWRLTYNQ